MVEAYRRDVRADLYKGIAMWERVFGFAAHLKGLGVPPPSASADMLVFTLARSWGGDGDRGAPQIPQAPEHGCGGDPEHPWTKFFTTYMAMEIRHPVILKYWMGHKVKWRKATWRPTPPRADGAI